MPASRVLLVDRDVDALASLAAKLRERGVRVSLASGSQMACERAKAGGFDVVLASREVAEPTDGSIGVLDALSVTIAEVPPLFVLDEDDSRDSQGAARLPRSDVARIVSKIEQIVALSGGAGGLGSLAPSAHALDGAPLADLLLVLGTERRSGTLTLTAPRGSGEIRLVDGEIADAVFVRLEGKKAIARMFGEGEGTVTFAPGAPAIMRRIHDGTRELVAEVRALADRAAELRASAEEIMASTLVAADMVVGEPGLGEEESGLRSSSEIEAHVLGKLRVPSRVDDVLDELPQSDAAILEAIVNLDAKGRIKRLGYASSRVQICGPDQLHLLRASASRSRAAGFDGPARLVFAGTPMRLAVFGHTVLALADAMPSSEPAPPGPMPYTVARIRLGDGVDLDIVVLPLVPAYAPLWPMALAGASTLVRLDDAASQALEEVCVSVSLPILDARAIFGTLEESSAVQVASLIKTALDAEGAALS